VYFNNSAKFDLVSTEKYKWQISSKGSFLGLDGKYHYAGSFLGSDGKYYIQGSFLGSDGRYHPKGSFLGVHGRYEEPEGLARLEKPLRTA